MSLLYHRYSYFLSHFWVALPANSWKGVIRVLELRNEKGQGLVEYALILVLVAMVVIAVLLLLGPVIGNAFSGIEASLLGF